MLSTREVVALLQGEGFDLSENYMMSLFRTESIPRPGKFGHVLAWMEQDVDNVRMLLRRRGRWEPPTKGERL